MPLEYVNWKGKVVPVTLSEHAIKQFAGRYNKLHPRTPLWPEKVIPTLEKLFSGASKVLNLSRKEKVRLKKHPRDTMYFRTKDFTFVVENQSIVTVEISAPDLRHLNKPRRRLGDLMKGGTP